MFVSVLFDQERKDKQQHISKQKTLKKIAGTTIVT